MHLRTLLFLTAAAVSLAVSGCVMPVSEHPLTDEKTSVLDERLIGYWNAVPRDKGERAAPAPHIIGRLKDKPNVLEMTWVELDSDGHAKVTQIPLYASKIGDGQYLSINLKEEGKEKSGYLICRYELDDDGNASLYQLNGDIIAKAIETSKLKGVVKRRERQAGANPNEPLQIEEIRITAEPKELSAYLKEQGKACYVLDEPMVFKRVRTE